MVADRQRQLVPRDAGHFRRIRARRQITPSPPRPIVRTAMRRSLVDGSLRKRPRLDTPQPNSVPFLRLALQSRRLEYTSEIMTTNQSTWATFEQLHADDPKPEREWTNTPYHSSPERRIKGSFTKAHKPKRIAWARWLREAKRREIEHGT